MYEVATGRLAFELRPKGPGLGLQRLAAHGHRNQLEASIGGAHQQSSPMGQQDGIENRGPAGNGLELPGARALGIHAIVSKEIAQFGCLEVLHHRARPAEIDLHPGWVRTLGCLQEQQIEQRTVDRSHPEIEGRARQIAPPNRAVAQQLQGTHRALESLDGRTPLALLRQQASKLGLPEVDGLRRLQSAAGLQGAAGEAQSLGHTTLRLGQTAQAAQGLGLDPQVPRDPG